MHVFICSINHHATPNPNCHIILCMLPPNQITILYFTCYPQTKLPYYILHATPNPNCHIIFYMLLPIQIAILYVICYPQSKLPYYISHAYISRPLHSYVFLLCGAQFNQDYVHLWTNITCCNDIVAIQLCHSCDTTMSLQHAIFVH